MPVMKAIEDKKRDYLMKTFSRTNRKDYENYVLNSIWCKLNRLDVQPVTQQFVKTQNGQSYLIDLYFPQLNYGIECDESHHIENAENDQTRTLTIQEVLDQVEEGSHFQIRRIRAYESLESINKQIDKLVDELREIIDKKDNFIPWEMVTATEFRNSRSEITINDRFRYRTLFEIAQVLGKNYKGNQNPYFPINQTYYAWCPHLSVVKDGKTYYFGKKGWINTLSENWETISETRAGKDSMDPLDTQSKHLRVTFVKSKDVFGKSSYRFIGVYEFDPTQSSQQLRRYKRLTTSFTIW